MSLIPVPRGDDMDLTIPIQYEDGSNVNLSGALVRWWMADSVADTEAAALLKKDNLSLGGLDLDEDSGLWTATVHLLHAETKNLSPRTYYHEVYVELGPSHKTVASGNLKITQTLIARQV